MKYIYTAGHFENRLQLQIMEYWIQEQLEKEHIDVRFNSHWIYEEPKELDEAARMDFNDVQNSNLVICTWPCRLGAACEISYALGLDIPVVFLLEKNLTKRDTMILATGMLIEYETRKIKDKVPGGYIVRSIEDLLECLKIYLT